MTLYWRREHMDDAPPGSIYVANSYEDPHLTMVPATFEEIKKWVADHEIKLEISDRGTLSKSYQPRLRRF